jgi:hypothetical protein
MVDKSTSGLEPVTFWREASGDKTLTFNGYVTYMPRRTVLIKLPNFSNNREIIVRSGGEKCREEVILHITGAKIPKLH